jgi:heme/copper-type cytochrome/quinol oxidase subunit 2
VLIRSALLGSALLLAAATRALAADPIQIVLKDNQFTPNEIRVPAGERFRIELQNQGTAPAELESPEMKIEKVVVPGGKITVTAGPLKPGAYTFVDEYHPETSGTVIAVQGLAER